MRRLGPRGDRGFRPRRIVTSQVTATPPISAATASARVGVEVEHRDLGALRRQQRAVAAPNPDAPPVTMAAWSFNHAWSFSLWQSS